MGISYRSRHRSNVFDPNTRSSFATSYSSRRPTIIVLIEIDRVHSKRTKSPKLIAFLSAAYFSKNREPGASAFETSCFGFSFAPPHTGVINTFLIEFSTGSRLPFSSALQQNGSEHFADNTLHSISNAPAKTNTQLKFIWRS